MARKKEVTYHNGRYMGSLDEETCDILDILRKAKVVPELKHCIFDLDDKLIDDILYNGQDIPASELPLGTLRDMQTVGVAYMYWGKKIILGDSVGLGKTAQVAGLINVLRVEYEKKGKDFRYLFLSEKTLIEQTRRDLVRFTGEYVELLEGDKKNNEEFSEGYANGCPYSVVGSHSLLNQAIFINWINSFSEFPFDMIVIDESSILGNPTTAITKSAKALLSKVDRRVFLNATPFESRLDIFYTQLDLIDEKLLPAKYIVQKEYFIMDYRGMYPRHTGKYKNASQFKNFILYRYLARTRLESGAEMLDCTSELVLSEVSKAQKHLFSRTQMWRMVCDCPSYIDKTIEFNEENVPKLASLRKLLTKVIPLNEQVLVYVPYKESQYKLVNWCEERGITCNLLNGEITKASDRNEIIGKFKRGEYKVLFTNVQKGLNFGNCDYTIFYSFDTNPQKMKQFEGRSTRDFDIIGKHLYMLCSRGREYKYLFNTVKQRAESSDNFTVGDYSCIMNLLKDLVEGGK